jgi:rod shape-determining protein MreD
MRSSGNNNHHFKLLFKTTILSIVLQLLPFPTFLETIMPLWSVVLFSFWLIFYGRDFPLLAAVVVGLVTDIFVGDILGQNALALLVVAFLLLKIKHNFTMSSIIGQQVLILIISLLFLFVYLGVNLLVTGFTIKGIYFIPAITTALIWIVFYFRK